MRAPVLLACFAIIATAAGQTQQFVGTYELIRFEHGKAVDNLKLPPGQVMIVELHKDGTFIMRDMLSGFEGSWALKKGNLELTMKIGPAGKLKKPDVMVMHPTPDHTRLVSLMSKAVAGQIEFHWNPSIVKQLNERLNTLFKNAEKQQGKKAGG